MPIERELTQEDVGREFVVVARQCGHGFDIGERIVYTSDPRPSQFSSLDGGRDWAMSVDEIDWAEPPSLSSRFAQMREAVAEQAPPRPDNRHGSANRFTEVEVADIEARTATWAAPMSDHYGHVPPPTTTTSPSYKPEGAKVGDVFRVTKDCHYSRRGDIVRFSRDDRTPNPYFNLVAGPRWLEDTAYINWKCLEPFDIEGSDLAYVFAFPETRVIESIFSRFREGAWNKLPATIITELDKAGIKLPILHFVHLSEKQPGLIAYTPDGDLERDRQVPCKMGKYLTMVAPDTPQPVIAHIANLFNLYCKEHLYSFDIARTAEDIQNVYQNGPNSCMGKDVSYFSSTPHHPTAVYESPDVGVAYIQDKVKERYVARAVIDMVGKKYAVIYGNDAALAPELKKLGYEQSSDGLDGCRLQKLTSDNGDDVMPYLDGEQGVSSMTSVEDGTQWWMVESGGDLEATNEGGVLDQGGRECDCCGRRGDEDDMNYSEHHESIIGECCIENYSYAYTGQYGQDWIHDDGLYFHNGNAYTPEALGDHDLALTDDGEVYSIDEVHFLDCGVYHTNDCVSYTDTSGDVITIHKDDEHLIEEDYFSKEAILKSDAFEYTPEDGDTLYSYDEIIEVDGELQAA